MHARYGIVALTVCLAACESTKRNGTPTPASSRDGGARDGGGASNDGGVSGDAGAKTATIASTDVPSRQAAAWCRKQFECCTAAEIADDNGAPDEATCQRDAETSLRDNTLIPNLDRARAQGRVEYHADHMAACIAAFFGLTCSEYSHLAAPPAPCADAIEGRVGHGGICQWDEECTSGYCATAATVGTCAAVPLEGQACGDPYRCAAGLYCDGQLVCRMKKADGEACRAPNECAGGDCSNDMCASTTYCDGQ